MEPLIKLFFKQQDQKYETYKKVSLGVGVPLKHIELSDYCQILELDVLSLKSIPW